MSDIAINPVTRRVQFTGNTGTGPFAFTFNILADSDIAVYKGTVLLTLTTDYTVSINANGTGSITLTVALIASDVLTIIGGRELSRTTDFVTAGDLLASSLNEQLDSNVIMTQQLDEKLGRGLFVNPGDVFTDLELPLKDDRKGTVLGFNATTGDPEPGPEIADVDSLANISADIKTLAEIQDGTVATDAITNVNTIRANVTTVSGISGNVTTVAGISSDVTTVAADGTDIGIVAGISSDVTTVSGISGNVTSVAGNASNINTVAADGADIGTVATSITNVNTVATDIANVNTNATNIASINTNATNITDIQNASANAASALASKNAAATSATNSANSATASETSRVASVAAQAAAETAETNAETAQTAAEAAQTAAETAETNAATSETNAASSASSASTDAGTATTKAGEAAASATASATSASASEAAKDAALAALDNFDDRYLGAKASDPTLDNDGNALVSGALYFNTTDDVMKVYDGSSWLAAYASLSGALLVANNLSDLASASAGRTNLGLGTAATSAATDFVAVTGDTMTGDLDVGGTVTADGLTVDGVARVQGGSPYLYLDNSSNTGSSRIYFGDADSDITGYFLYDHSTNSLRTGVNGSERMRIDSSGNVGIGTSSPSEILTLDDTDPKLAFRDAGVERAFLQVDTSNNFLINNKSLSNMIFETGDTERMRIDSSGNVGIGITPSVPLHVNGRVRVDGGSNDLDIYHNGSVAYIETTGGSATPIGFANSGTERMRIDSSGNLLVGKTSAADINTNGFQVESNGRTGISRDSGSALLLNRTSSDGPIALFRKDGSTVGSLSTQYSGLNIDGAANRSGIYFASSSLTPRFNGAQSNNTIDLGTSAQRFKDGHFSGTVNAANFNTTSDATLKTNVETLSGSLDAVKSLRGVSFDWLENGGSEIGVIAQEVEAVLPDVVSTNDEGIKSVKYGNMVAVLIEAIKEQQAQIDELKAKLGE